MSDSQLILGKLVLHLGFVFLQVRQSLLQVDVLLSLGGHCLVEELGVVLHYWHDVLQVVVVHCL